MNLLNLFKFIFIVVLAGACARAVISDRTSLGEALLAFAGTALAGWAIFL